MQLISKQKLKRKPAFTLIETLIYIAILGSLLFYFVSFSLSIGSSRSKTHVIQEVNANARIVLKEISNQVRGADDVIDPVSGNTGNSLNLDMPAPDDDILFILENGILKNVIATATTSITSSEVEITNLNFDNLALSGERDNIRISLTIEYRDAGSKEYEYSRDFQTSVSLRH